jgi:uncharacterized coiled-coil DUF342 family protein
MPVKEDLKRKVPDFVKDTPEWPVFLRWVSQNKLETRAQLKFQLNEDIRECQEKLREFAKSREGTNNRVTRVCAKKLGFLKLVRDKIVKYA